MLWAACQIRKISGCAFAGTFSPPPRVSNSNVHHGTCVTHVPWCMPGSLTSGFFWSWWRGKHSRQTRRMRSLQFYVSGKRPIQSLVYCRQQLACENEHHLISLKAVINEVVVSARLVIPYIGLVIKKRSRLPHTTMIWIVYRVFPVIINCISN